MIASVTTSTPQFRASAPAQRPAPAPTPSPAAPADGLDLTTIDTPQKVVQLPLFEPTVQMGLAGAVVISFLSAMGGGSTPALSVAFGSSLNQVFTDSTGHLRAQPMLSANYEFNAQDPQAPLSATGNITWPDAQTTLSGSLATSFQNEVLQWKGTVGSSAENLSFRLSSDAQSPGIVMEGTVGSVPVNLTFNALGDLQALQGDPESFEGFTVKGTVGDLPYQVENRVKLDNSIGLPGVGQTAEVGTLTSRGSLGQDPIVKDYQVQVSHFSEDGVSILATGQGVNAGVPQPLIAGSLRMTGLPS